MSGSVPDRVGGGHRQWQQPATSDVFDYSTELGRLSNMGHVMGEVRPDRLLVEWEQPDVPCNSMRVMTADEFDFAENDHLFFNSVEDRRRYLAYLGAPEIEDGGPSLKVVG
jgi:hypothetical protein